MDRATPPLLLISATRYIPVQLSVCGCRSSCKTAIGSPYGLIQLWQFLYVSNSTRVANSSAKPVDACRSLAGAARRAAATEQMTRAADGEAHFSS